jgi:hypothetical protein
VDAGVLIVIGLLCVALFVAAGADVIRSRRARRAAPAPRPVGPRRLVLVCGDVPDLSGWSFDAELQADGAAVHRAMAHEGDVLLVGSEEALRGIAAQWLGLPDARFLHLDEGAVSVLERIGQERVVRRWNVSGSPAGPPPAAG